MSDPKKTDAPPYTEEDLRISEKWLANRACSPPASGTDFLAGKVFLTVEEASAFRAEARREAYGDLDGYRDLATAVASVVHGGEHGWESRTESAGGDLRRLADDLRQWVKRRRDALQSEREACERIVEEAVGGDGIWTRNEIMRRLRERAK